MFVQCGKREKHRPLWHIGLAVNSDFGLYEIQDINGMTPIALFVRGAH